jgi:hypothetical protein
MSYHCGIGEGLEKLGMTPCEPHIACDNCGVTRSVYKNNKAMCGPAAWFLDGKKAPGGWSGGRTEIDARRIDYCPKCTELRKEKK